MGKKTLIRCAAVLLAAIFGLAVADNVRPWKRLQVEFFELERRQLRSRLEATRAATAETVADLEARIESQQARLAADRHDEIVELEEDLRRFGGKARGAELRRGRLESGLERLPATELDEQLRQTRMEIESLGELIADRERKLAAVRSDLEAARADLARTLDPIEDLEDRLAALPARPVLPAGGLLAPGVAVREVSLPAAAGTEARVDRCVTCHLAATRDDVESDDWPAPLRRHPDRGLFLSADSPHPYRRFGCATCHGGEGRATGFSRAGHSPATPEQARHWQEDLDWRPPRDGRAMLPLDLTAAACGRCHHGGDLAPERDESGLVVASRMRPLEHGRRLIAALGCTACHASDHPSPAAASRVGPSLRGIAGKTTPAWVYRWLEAPRTLRETRMPHVFGPGEDRRSAEIRAVVDYLWQVSRPEAYPPPPAGDVEAGRALFESVGCSGCHLVGLEADLQAPFERRHGPHLTGTGSKVGAGWLYAWLRDPRAYRRDTPMPSLRLDEREAADLTAYLMTRRDPAWENLSLPATRVETRDRLALSALEREETIERSQERLESMSERNRNLYLGEQTLARYGCHSCHEIAGLEQAPAPGPGLSAVSRGLRDRLTSPNAALPGRWQAASHRPAYDLDDGEARAVTVALLGLAGDGDDLRRAGPTGERAAALARGRRVVDRYNCRGCHRIEGTGGLDDGARGDTPAGTPPDLAHAGARLRSSWLFDYLADPGSREVRPWLEVRMPTFGLSEAENNALVRYFAALDGRPLFTADPPAALPAASIAVGKVVFGMLQCEDCHRPPGTESLTPQLAPAYGGASERLRSDWVVDLILDPERWLPGSPMPASFRPDDSRELNAEFLVGSINTPIFAVERDRLLRLLGSEDELDAYLSDPERVAAALRDYLWTLRR